MAWVARSGGAGMGSANHGLARFAHRIRKRAWAHKATGQPGASLAGTPRTNAPVAVGLAMALLGADVGGVFGYETMTPPVEAEVVADNEILETVVTLQARCRGGKEATTRMTFKPGKDDWALGEMRAAV